MQLIVTGWRDGRIPVAERMESPFGFFFFELSLCIDSSSGVVCSLAKPAPADVLVRRLGFLQQEWDDIAIGQKAATLCPIRLNRDISRRNIICVVFISLRIGAAVSVC